MNRVGVLNHHDVGLGALTLDRLSLLTRGLRFLVFH